MTKSPIPHQNGVNIAISIQVAVFMVVHLVYAVTFLTANETIRRVRPLKNMLIATSVPTTHVELAGHPLPTITANKRVTMPSNSNHPLPGSGRRKLERTISTTPWKMN